MLQFNIIGNKTSNDDFFLQNVQEITIDKLPITNKWKLIPLYKNLLDGNCYIWQIGYDGENKIYIMEGFDDNPKYSSESITSDPLKYCRSLYINKIKEYYFPSGPDQPTIIKPMKPLDYNENSIKQWPVYTQPNFSGFRLLSYMQYNHSNKPFSVNFRSGSNNLLNNLNYLEPEILQFLYYLPKYATLDGELYHSDITSKEISSMIKNGKELPSNIKYNILDVFYDFNCNYTFDERYLLLINAYHRYCEDFNSIPQFFTIVPCNIASSHSDIILQRSQYISSGSIGLIAKKIKLSNDYTSKLYKHALYKQNKCSNILKY